MVNDEMEDGAVAWSVGEKDEGAAGLEKERSGLWGMMRVSFGRVLVEG